jgi:pimeloyl-ACP methyl ester carboxylesterase
VQHHVLSSGAAETHYWTSGPAGAPWLVVCHGGALDHSDFRPLAAALADRYRVLLWDLPGHGRSQPMPEPYSVQRCVDTLAAVLDDAGVDAAALLGFSFGGVVAQVYAAQAPGRERGVIAYACLTPHLLRLPVPAWSLRPLTWLLFGRLSWPRAKRKYAALCSAQPAVRAAVEASMEPLGHRGLAAMIEAQYRLRAYDPGLRFNGPVMVIYGERDPHARSLGRVATAVRNAYPRATVVRIPGAGHCAHAEDPVAFAAAIAHFLDHRGHD